MNEGIKAIKDALDNAGTNYRSVLKLNLSKVASITEREIKILTPKDRGFLESSNRFEIVDRDDGVTLTHYNNMEYAAKQHDDMRLRHPVKGQAKFIEIPFYKHLPDYKALPSKILKRLLDGQ